MRRCGSSSPKSSVTKTATVKRTFTDDGKTTVVDKRKITLTVGSKKQSAWLLYVATFPLTQLDTPSHAEYKAELRPMVEPYARDLDAYYILTYQPSQATDGRFHPIQVRSKRKDAQIRVPTSLA